MNRIAAAAIAASLGLGAAHAEDAGERRLRCSVPSDAPLFARSPGAVSGIVAGRTTPVHPGAPLPRVMVDGWRPAPGPLSSVLGQLGSAAGFKVVGAEGFGPVSWTGSAAPLPSVVDALTAQAGATWSFGGGVLSISKGATSTVTEASIALPSSRDAALALLDTLRGLDAKEVGIHGSAITFSASPEVLSRIRRTVSGIGEIFAFDVAFLEARPIGGSFSWKTAGGVASGPAFVVFGDDAESRLAALLRTAEGTPRSDGMQTVSGPGGWALVVPENQCGAGSGEVVLKPRRMGDGFALDVQGGGFTSSVPLVGIGQTVVVSSSSRNGDWTRLISIRPRIVSVR